MPIKWPMGHYSSEYKELPQHLLWMAAHHARNAGSLGGTTDIAELNDQAVSIGTAAELLAKSTLAGISFHLIAADTKVPTLLTLSGVGDSTPLPDLSTIGAETAVSRLNIADGNHFNIRSKNYELVYAVRNSALHLGAVSTDANRDALVKLVDLVHRIFVGRQKLEQPGTEDQFWGPKLLPYIKGLLNEAHTATRRMYHDAIHQAKHNYEKLIAAIGHERHAEVVAQLANTEPYIEEFDYDTAVEPEVCPACGNKAWLVYHVYRGDPQFEVDDDGRPGPTYVSRAAIAETLRCSVCKLNLSSPELEFAGLDRTVDLEEDDATSREIQDYEDAAVESYIDQDWDSRHNR